MKLGALKLGIERDLYRELVRKWERFESWELGNCEVWGRWEMVMAAVEVDDRGPNPWRKEQRKAEKGIFA